MRLDDFKEGAYEFFEGKLSESIPLILGKNLEIIDVRGAVKKRLEVAEANYRPIRNRWLNNHFDTLDAVAHNFDKFKIDSNSKALKEINKKSVIINGALIKTEDYYNSIDSEEFNLEDFNSNKAIIRLLEDLDKSHLFKTLIGEDVLRKYMKLIKDIKTNGLRYDYLPIYTDYVPKELIEVRPIRINSIQNNLAVLQESKLDSDFGFLVGKKINIRYSCDSL